MLEQHARHLADHIRITDVACRGFWIDRNIAPTARLGRRHDRSGVPGRHPPDDLQQVGLADRLGNIVIHACLQTAIAIAFHRIRRHRDDRYLLETVDRGYPAAPQFAGADRLRRLKPVHDGHLHVHQDDVEMFTLEALDRLLAIGRNADPVAGLFKQMQCQFLIDQVVFDEQHLQATSRPGSLRRMQRGFDIEIVELEHATRTADRQTHRIEQICLGHRLDEMHGDAKGLQFRQLVTLSRHGYQGDHRLVASLRQPGTKHSTILFEGNGCIDDRQRERQAGSPALVRKGACCRHRRNGLDWHAPAFKRPRQPLLGGIRVADQQHALPGQHSGQIRHRSSALTDAQRQRKPEGAALALLADNSQLAAHQLDEPRGNGKPEPGSSEATGSGYIRLREGLEQLPDLVGGDTDPGVAHLDPELHFVAGHRLGAHRDGHAAGRGELDRIADEVREHLAQAQGVAPKPHRQGRCHVDSNIEPFLLRADRQRAHRLENDRRKLEVDALDLQFSGLDLGKIEDVVHDD